jgi:cell wall-associated NlpC family hydrolase
MNTPRILLRILTLTALTVATALALAAPALAKSYSDVPKSHWAYASISSVTNRTVDGHRLLDDYAELFRPERAITRQLLARSVVLASGHYGEKITPVVIADVPKGHRYYTVIQMAVHQGYMALDKAGNFQPTKEVTAATAETVVTRWLKQRYSSFNWSLLTTLHPSRWKPNTGWTTGAPSYLPAIVASRQLQLRYNHSSDGDGHEVIPREPIDRAEIAYMFDRAYKVASGWQLYGLADFNGITFPPLSDRQKQVVKFAFKWIGYPYVWAGEYPTPESPYGAQKSGGFDCSGFVFYVMKMHFGYPITVNERGAHDMAARAKPRITRDKLKCGDLIFFGPKGPSSSVESIYHTGLYLGRGWFIHSTGSSDGVTLASLNTSSYWKSAFAWGRRVLTAAELVVPTPSPSASPAPAAAPAPETSATPTPEASTASPSAAVTPEPSPAQP